MKWSIITDSSCDLNIHVPISQQVQLDEVPFVMNIDGKDYVDTVDLDVPDMIDAMEASAQASRSSCPAPGEWYEKFKQADHIIAITISHNLSGSYNSAITARGMILEKYPEKKIFVLDSLSAGSVLAMYALKAVEFIENGFHFEDIVQRLKEYAKERHTIFALASFNNLVKNGRVSKLSGFIAGKLGIWGIGIASPEGTIQVKSKLRGMQRVLNSFIEDMKENGFKGGQVIISHCQNSELAGKLKEKIQEHWDAAKVNILPTGGLCSYYAERKGLIVGY